MKKIFHQIITNAWTVTLVGTMLGVFAGIYINNYYNELSKNREHRSALDKIQEELASNEERIKTNYDSMYYFYEPLEYLFGLVNEDGNLIMTTNQKEVFMDEYPDVLEVRDSSLVDANKYDYDANFNIDFINLLSIELSAVAWETFKVTSLSASTDFDCLYQLELTYKLQDRLVDKFDIWLNSVQELGADQEGRKSFLREWLSVMEYEEAILDLYPEISICNE